MKVLAQVCALLAVMAFVGVAQAKEKGAGTKALHGQVVKVDGTNLIIKTGKAGQEKEVTVATDANTQVMIEGAPAKLSDLKAGQKVTVTPATGVATKITVPKPKATK